MSVATVMSQRHFTNKMNDEIKIIKLLKGRDIYHVKMYIVSKAAKKMFHILTRTCLSLTLSRHRRLEHTYHIGYLCLFHKNANKIL